MKFTVKKNKDSQVAHTFEYNTGTNLDEKVALFGASVVNEKADDSIIISAQGIVRRQLEKGASPADVQLYLNAWKPGVTASRVVTKPMTAEEMIAALMSGSIVFTEAQKLAMLEAASK